MKKLLGLLALGILLSSCGTGYCMQNEALYPLSRQYRMNCR